MQEKDIHQLQNFWHNNQLREYIGHQIQESGFRLYRILKQYVCLLYQITKEKDSQQQLIFIITLGKGYPLSAPHVHILEAFTRISIRGYKDFLGDILEEEWDFKFTLKTIKENIPQFILKLKQSDNSLYQFQSLGKYHLNYLYSYDLLKDLAEYGPYIAFETEEETVKMLVVTVTETHFVVFQPLVQPVVKNNKLNVPKEHEIELMKVVFIAQMQGLLQIRHNRAQKNEFTFIFNGEEVKTKTIGIFAKKLKITNSQQMIQSLLKQFKHFKGTIQLQSSPSTPPSEEQILLEEVSSYEEEVKHHFNKQSVSKLNECYHKLVEFYSNSSLPYQDIFIRKISALLGQEDVRFIMSDSPKAKHK